MNEEFYYVVAAIVGVLSVARLTRLLTNDDFPPSEWIRTTWDKITKEGAWSALARCLWCASPYITAAVLAWGLLSHFHWTWWVFNGWMAASYVASWLVFHDEDGFSK